jgi:GntR family transcriptional regulator
LHPQGVIQMRLRISPSDGKPIYKQIVEQVMYLVAAGRLERGDELPPIRTLAEQLLINPNTVARAYRELETAGVLVKRQGAGTYVADAGSPLAEEERTRILTERIDQLLALASQLAIGADTLMALIRDRSQALTIDPVPRGEANDPHK